MMKKQKSIPFTKMSGTGNDFIVFDNRSRHFSGDEGPFFQTICQRRTSVGADGILLIEKSQSAAVRMRYFNRDGGESTMCGNGARCCGYYARHYGWVDQDQFQLETADGIHPVTIKDRLVTLGMIPPEEIKIPDSLLEEKKYRQAGAVNTGVPHFVIFVQNLEEVPVGTLGPYYRKHSAFSQGSNVNFVELAQPNTIHVRTYERGVEKETLSCGTGCVASAFFASREPGFNNPIHIITRGGDLTVGFDTRWEEVSLTGLVQVVYDGHLQPSV